MKKDIKTTEERYKILFESVKDIIVILDKKGRIVDINPAIKKLSGFNPKEIIGRYFQELKILTPQSKKIIKKNLRKRLRGVATASYEIEAKSRNGKKLTVEVNAVPFVKNGNVVGSLAILRDITEHKKADEALRESEEKYRTLVNNVNIGVYRNTGGSQGRFIQANPAIAKMFGYGSVEEFMKIFVSDLYQDKKDRKRFVDEILRAGFVKNQELRLRKKDGTPIIASCTAKIQYDKNNNIKWMDGVIEDISERKSKEEARQRFVEIATHQLRSPLVSCIWTLDFLKSSFAKDLEPEALKYLEQMNEHIEKLLSLAEDLLNTTKIESGLSLSNVKKIYLGKFISRIIQANQVLLNRKKITIKADFKKHSRILIESDLTKLDDIVDNLINNAIKYSRDGSEIQIGCRKFKKHLIIYIKDKGIGIPEKEKDKIFDRFFRASNAVKQNISGSGLGLFIAQRFTELLGGDLYFQSRQNKGSTFFLKLPLKIKSK